MAQTGPGGIGNSTGANGQPENVIWLDASQLSLSDGDGISSWSENSGNNFTFLTEAGLEPIFNANQVNGLPAAEFNSTNNRLVLNPFSSMPTAAISAFIVLNTNSNGQEALVSYNTSSEDNEFIMFYPKNVRVYIDGSNISSGADFSNGSWGILGTTWKSSDGDLVVLQDGDTVSTSSLKTGASISNGGSLVIGAEQDDLDGGYDANQNYEGQIAEIIIFNSELNNAQKNILNNYLSAKYGITLGANELYSGDDNGYDFDVIGIGKTADGSHELANSTGLILSPYNSSLDDDEYIIAGHNNTTNLVTADSLAAGIEQRWARTWYIEKTGSLGATITFDFGDGIDGKYPQNITNYALLKWDGAEYAEVTVDNITVNGDKLNFEVSDANLSLTGIYTVGTKDETNSPIEGGDNRTWYSYQTGNWNDPATWTADGAANPSYLNPSSEIPSATDNVVINISRNVTIQSTNNNITVSNVRVEGILDLTTSYGHDFTAIEGDGTIKMSGYNPGSGTEDNFPDGETTLFADSLVGGTVEVHGSGILLNQERVFNNLEFKLDNGADEAVLLSDYQINGYVSVDKGTLMINDNTSTTDLTIDVFGNFTVRGDNLNEGSLLTGEGNARHQLNLFSNFTNNKGVVKFTNRGAANYSTEATNGIVDVNFLHDTRDQILQCYGETVFYRIEIDKGTDATYTLQIDASQESYFKLYGYASHNHSDNSQLTSNDNAIGLLRGTLKIGPNVVIPKLSRASNYNISAAAAIWVDGGSVTKDEGTAIVPYGTAKITSGIFEALVNSGFTLRENGSLIVEGGILNTNQIRTSVLGAQHIGGYTQTGGTTNVLGGSTATGYYNFNLTFPGNVFSMTGGILHVVSPNSRGGIFINSDPGNINVSGGTVIMEIDNSNDFIVTSRAPFWDVEMRNTAGNTKWIKLNGGTAADGTSSPQTLANQPLVVKNDLTIESNARFKTMNADVYIGRNFTIEDDALYDDDQATTIFDGTEDGIFYIGDITEFKAGGANNSGGINAIIDDADFGFTDPVSSDCFGKWEYPLHNLTINKPGATLYLASKEPSKGVNPSGSNLSTFKTGSGKNVNSWSTNLIKVVNSFSLLDGTLDQMDPNYTGVGYSLTLYNADITNKGTVFTYEDGVTPKESLTKLINSNGVGDFTITTESDAIFGNIRLHSGDNIVSFTSDVHMKRIEYRYGKINLGANNLKIDILDINNISSQDPSTTNMFYTAGKASDGGLSLKVSYPVPTGYPSYVEYQTSRNSYNKPDQLYFPIGVSGKYTPVVITIDTTTLSDDGYVTVNPVEGELATVVQPTSSDVLTYYWRVRHSDFTTLPTLNSIVFTSKEADDPDGGATPSGLPATFGPGKVLDEQPYTRTNEVTGNISGYTITFNGDEGLGTTPFTLENANYTAGDPVRFTGSVKVYYTRDHGTSTGTAAREPRWDDINTWTSSDILIDANGDLVIDEKDWHDSRQPAAADYPKAGDVVHIGWVPWDDDKTSLRGRPHGVWVDNDTQECAIVNFTQMLDASGNPTDRVYRSNFQFRPTLCINGGSAVLNTGLVRGEGMFWNRYSDPDFTTMDFAEFAEEDSSYVVYETTADPATISLSPDAYPNLIVATNGWGQQDKDIIFDKNVVTNGNFEILGDINVILDNDATGDITVKKDLLFTEFDGAESSPSGGGGELLFDNSGTDRTVTVFGDIIMENNGAIIQVNSPNNTDVRSHQINLYGDYLQNTTSGGGMTLFTALDEDVINLSLLGDSSMTFNVTSGTTPELYRLIVNKTDSTVTSTFNSDFELNGETDQDAYKALELQSGRLILNHEDIAINLTTAGDEFQIPAGAGLEIQAGKAYVSGDDSGIYLDGLLRINGANAELNMDISDATNPGNGLGQNGNNYIEYSVSENAQLEIYDGLLTVGGQVRRGTASSNGVLKYVQTGGSVYVGKNNGDAEPTRGVFEILNYGSSFEHNGGSLALVKSNGSGTVGSLFLDPETYNLDGSTITIGDGSLSDNESFGINSTIPLANLVIDTATNLSASLYSNPLTINGELLNNGSLTASSLDLTLNADFINNGTYTGSSNTTYFYTESIQNYSGTGTADFYHLTKNGTGTLRTNKDITVNQTLTISDGTFDDQGHSVFAKGDVINDAIHTSTGGRGIVMNGTLTQTLSRSAYGTSQFGVLTISNTNGVEIPDGTGYTFQINNKLVLEDGILNIGGNLLEIGVSAAIENDLGNSDVTAFNSNSMIQTNSSFTDNGVRKNFPANYNAADFVFPVGEQKYTPALFNFSVGGNSSGSTAGSLTVRPANEYHPVIISDGVDNTAPQDIENVLQYHWLVGADNLTGFTADMELYYDQTSVLTNDPSYDEDDYYAARILDVNTSIEKFAPASIDEVNNVITFEFSSIGEAGISGDYFAGIDDAIPDAVTIYTTTKIGVVEDDVYDNPVPGGGAPQGAILVVESGHTLTFDIDDVKLYKTEIKAGAVLEIDATQGHRLGILTGNGTLRLKSNTNNVVMPAAYTTDFFSCDNESTLEYAGTGDYSILGGIPILYNLTLSEGGQRTLPSQDIIICNDLTLNGPDLTDLSDKKITVKGDIIYNAGTLDSGDGTFVLDGTTDQSITGATSGFTGTNSFANLEINKAAGDVNLGFDIDINDLGTLSLTNGIVRASTFRVFLNGSSVANGGSSSSFVDGQFSKEVFNGQDFEYPIGDANNYNPMSIYSATADEWVAQYININPSDEEASIENNDPDPGSVAVEVSQGEYWKLKHDINPTGTTSVEIGWNTNTGVSEYDKLLLMQWDRDEDASNKHWDVIGTSPIGSNSSGTIKSNSAVSFSTQYFTLGASDLVILPVEFLSFEAVKNRKTALLKWETTQEFNNSHFVIEHSTDGRSFAEVGDVDALGGISEINRYRFTMENPVNGTNYFRLKQVDNDGKFDYSNVLSLEYEIEEEKGDNVENPLGESVEFIAYPNPIPNYQVSLYATGFTPNAKVLLTVVDMMGKSHFKEIISLGESGNLSKSLNLPYSLPSGLYNIVLRDGKKTYSKKVIVK
ncbi:T9SS type A sorting domain-containing protein [Flammeovirgaceae bacterium SG7u.111]|nr:T9SS type A sorting domain-containing protein [Flammeovirgaceae bacterium SG7u.132]WPO37735.1 T9SS type A sorting domain-containing protein [Flammeovirgaceae bacterium SG7u.111]